MKVLKWLDRHLEEVVVVVLTSVILIALFLQIVFRTFGSVINISLGWTEELSVNALPWLCYFGSSLAVRSRSHMRIEILTHFLPPRAQKVFDIIADLCFLFFAVFVLYYTSTLTYSIFQSHITTAVLGWPKWVFYIGIPIAFLLTVYRLVVDLVKLVKEYKAIGQEAPPPADALAEKEGKA